MSSAVSCLYSPLSGDSWNDTIYVAGRPAPGPADTNYATWDRVSPGYFETIGNPIVRGRAISEQDSAGSPHVAGVNEAFARKFFRGEDPIGKRFGRADIRKAGDFEIVGVAKDARHLTYDLDKPVGALFFVPAAQWTVFGKPEHNVGETRSHFLHDIVIRTKPGVQLTEAQVRHAIASVDSKLPVIGIQSLARQVEDNFAQQRLIARLTSMLGIVALVLASLGVYGVTAYNVGSRTNEIGIRMALGADRRDVLALILRGALALIAVGLLLGLPLTLAAGRLLEAQLYGINRYDPAIIASAILMLALSTLIAALIPAFRASTVSPMEALRAE